MRRFYTAESVTEGNPDKLCDLIADSILDECLKQDPGARVACEALASRGYILIAGEITCQYEPYILWTVKEVLEKVGYPFGETQVEVRLHCQNPDTAGEVQHPLEKRERREKKGCYVDTASGYGAGGQGVMVGYACNETPQKMPLPVVLANRITAELSACRKSRYIHDILPDGKAQVTVEYEDGKPIRLDSVVVSCQHREGKDSKQLDQEIREKVLSPALRLLPPDADTRILVNPSGRFVEGGLDADTGLTGRKLMADTYGSQVPHGGGSFSGKDGSRVERSGAYMARYIAKNIVAAGLAGRCQVSLGYALRAAQPVMVQVDTFGTGSACEDDCLAAAVPLVFDLAPKQIMDTFRLKRPIFRQTAAYGHFGRKEFPWERTDRVKQLQEALL